MLSCGAPTPLGLAAALLAVSLLVPDGVPVDVAVDDTLFKRRGKEGLGCLVVP